MKIKGNNLHNSQKTVTLDVSLISTLQLSRLTRFIHLRNTPEINSTQTCLIASQASAPFHFGFNEMCCTRPPRQENLWSQNEKCSDHKEMHTCCTQATSEVQNRRPASRQRSNRKLDWRRTRRIHSGAPDPLYVWEPETWGWPNPVWNGCRQWPALEGVTEKQRAFRYRARRSPGQIRRAKRLMYKSVHC